MSTSTQLIRRFFSHDTRMGAASLPTYGPPSGVRTRPDLVFVRGSGMKLWDAQGKEYLDFAAGIAVNVLGHCPPLLTKTLESQSRKLGHVSNLYHTEENLALCEKLIQVSPGFSKVFLCNSGTEANEASLKFAALLAHARGETQRKRVISFKNSFHGRTLGALSVTYKPAIRAPFKSLLNANVDFLEFNNLEQVKQYMERDVLAVIVEPVQGEGGVNPASISFLQGLRGLCNEFGATLIFDEVQVGIGRCGTMWGYEAYPNVVPDLLSCAKPLAGGLPIGASLISSNFFDSMPAGAWTGAHGTTFGGNPLVSKVALEVLNEVSSPAFLARTKVAGSKLIQGLVAIQERHRDKIKAIKRPLGDSSLYAGVQLTSAVASKVVLNALERGVVFITAGDYGETIRICPPLIATEADVTKALQVLEEAIVQVDSLAVVGSGGATTHNKVQVLEMDRTVTFANKEAHRAFVNCPLPDGFKIGVDKLSFVPKELESKTAFPMRMTLLALEKATDRFALVMTQNAFPGAPIRVCREWMNEPMAGVLINNKVSNVHPRGGGVKDSRLLSEACSQLLHESGKILPASTGVIGWSLPVKEMLDCLPRVVKNLQVQTALSAAEAIMTTDRYPKARMQTVALANGKSGKITGIAKGAGMIEPNLATMLVYIMTDVALDKKTLQRCLNQAMSRSFNRISVDSDQSTSDMVLLMSSGKVGDASDEEVFSQALNQVCYELAEDIVRNGEGTRHVMCVRVKGCPTAELAHGTGKAVVNSPLVKTAIYGNDPNVGRIIAAVGSFLGKQPSYYVSRTMASRASVSVGGIVVFEKGEFALNPQKEAQLNEYMKLALIVQEAKDFPTHQRVVDIEVDFHSGDEETLVMGSDLSEEYVEVNADYRS